MTTTTLSHQHALYLPHNFYSELVRRIVVYCGNEYTTQDFHSAVQTLNSELKLSLQDTEQRILGLLLTSLSQAARFGGDMHFCPPLGENSAIHSCHSAILVNELFRRAEALNGNATNISMRLDATMCCLVHDMGEILGEFNSIAQRANDQHLIESTELEREIFETALRLATESVLSHRHDRFYQSIQELRSLAGISSECGCNVSGELVRKVQSMRPDNMSHEGERIVQLFLSLYDIAELHKSSSEEHSTSLFLGYLVKATEHMQGARHFARFSYKEEQRPPVSLFYTNGSSRNTSEHGTHSSLDASARDLLLPTHLSPSYKVMRTLDYIEGELGELFVNARTPHEKKLAQTARDMAYQTIVEWLNIAPAVIDRHALAVPSPIVEVHKKLQSQKTVHVDERLELRDQLRSNLEAEVLRCKTEIDKQSISPGPNRLNRYTTREELMGLYLHALHTGYEPKAGETLARCDIIANQLMGFSPFSSQNLLPDSFESLRLPPAVGDDQKK